MLRNGTECSGVGRGRQVPVGGEGGDWGQLNTKDGFHIILLALQTHSVHVCGGTVQSVP